MELINRIRKSRKGFTLVEIIVVLVILAILAAFTIPAMLGFVNEAKGKALIAEAREVYVAAQAVATEYGSNGLSPTGAQLSSVAVSATTPTGASLQMKNYLNSDITVSTAVITNPPTSAVQPAAGESSWIITLDSAYKVTKVIYVKNGYAITITEPAGTTTTTKL